MARDRLMFGTRKRKWIQVTPRERPPVVCRLECGCGWATELDRDDVSWVADVDEAWEEHTRECPSASYWGWEVNFIREPHRTVAVERRITERPVA